MRLSIAVLALCLLSTHALAQPAGDTPGMATMDRFGQQSKLGASLTYVGFDSDFVSDVTGARFDVYGQYLASAGAGGYAVLPIGYLDGDGDRSTIIGNIELGGLLVVHGNVPGILRVGLTLPTSYGDDSGAELSTFFARFTDVPQSEPDTTWLRLSAHPMIRSGTGFFQADLGLDIPIDGGGIDTLIRANVGGGIETGHIALMAELVNTASTESDVDNRWVTFLGFTVRLMNVAPVRPSISFQIPIDDNFDDLIDFLLILGLEYPMPAS